MDASAIARGATPERATDDQMADLVERFGPTLYRVAYSIVGDRATAEDIVQEVLVKAWTSMPSWDGDTPIRWARTVTRNTAISHLRSASNRLVAPTEHLEPLGAQVVGPDTIVERDAEVDRMWQALERLGADERAMLVMHEVEGLSYDEIALTLDISTSSVKSKLYRARVALRATLAREDRS